MRRNGMMKGAQYYKIWKIGKKSAHINSYLWQAVFMNNKP